MRIAHVTDCYLPRLGGIEMHVRDLAARQARCGHELTVITSTRGPAPPDARVAVVRVDGRPRPEGRIGYWSSRRARAAVIAGGFDVVHVHASAFSPLSFLAAHHASNLGIPTVVTIHSLWASAAPLFRIADRMTSWGSWALEWSAVSEAAAAAPRRVVRSRSEVAVVANGVDSGAWRVDPVAGSRDELRLVAVGRLAPRKRTIHLARLLQDASRRLPAGTRLAVEFIGDGPERHSLERYLTRHNMHGWVQVRGALSREEIRASFARSDLFISAAVLESFGIAALEARCAGLPVLARLGTGTQDFLVDGVEGWLVGSDREMADRIVALAGDRDRLDGVAAHNIGTEPGITWAVVLRACDSLYRQAAARHGRMWPDPASSDDVAVPVAGT